jgi:glutamine amidotransferase
MDAGDGVSSALAAAVTTVKQIAGGRLTCLMTDGARIVGCTFGDTLFVRRDRAGVTVASEPYDDDPAWEQAPDMSLITADPAHTEISTL